MTNRHGKRISNVIWLRNGTASATFVPSPAPAASLHYHIRQRPASLEAAYIRNRQSPLRCSQYDDTSSLTYGKCRCYISIKKQFLDGTVSGLYLSINCMPTHIPALIGSSGAVCASVWIAAILDGN